MPSFSAQYENFYFYFELTTNQTNFGMCKDDSIMVDFCTLLINATHKTEFYNWSILLTNNNGPTKICDWNLQYVYTILERFFTGYSYNDLADIDIKIIMKDLHIEYVNTISVSTIGFEITNLITNKFVIFNLIYEERDPASRLLDKLNYTSHLLQQANNYIVEQVKIINEQNTIIKKKDRVISGNMLQMNAKNIYINVLKKEIANLEKVEFIIR